MNTPATVCSRIVAESIVLYWRAVSKMFLGFQCKPQGHGNSLGCPQSSADISVINYLLVIYCCLTFSPKFNSLNQQNTFIISPFSVGQVFGSSTVGVHAQGLSYSCGHVGSLQSEDCSGLEG